MALDPVLALAASLLMAVIFAAGAVEKLRQPWMFAAIVQAYGLLPAALVTPAAWSVALAEAALALALCLPGAHPWASWGGLLLLAVVTAAVVVNLLRGRVGIDCGCGGASADQELSWSLVWRNLGLVGLLGLPFMTGSGRVLGAADYLTVAFAVVAGFGLYAGANQLLANAPRLHDLVEGHA
ncbi:MAG: methylamine utilization protein MauE [Gammaproteobacteria bacterium]|nr:methylamine utilization protein MauE [Gammaproteobacteria bacterium]